MERMRNAFFISDSIFSPIALGSSENFNEMLRGSTGIRHNSEGNLGDKPFWASIFSKLEATGDFTRFEEIALTAARQAVGQHRLDADRTIFILSTTKGNISQLNSQNPKRIHLHDSTRKIAGELGIKNILTVSNACISGVTALLMGQRLLQTGRYEHALVVGAEELSKFIVSGFQSLFAMGDSPCKPFDKNRNGITLGEGAGAVLLSTTPNVFQIDPQIEITGSGAISNDANHISGPSRTGLELAQAIASALKNAGAHADDVDLLSAHGTATIYNDEMEAKAFRAAGLSQNQVHSLKGYFGHTLGAAGVIETIIAKECMLNDMLLSSMGYSDLGVSEKINVIDRNERKKISRVLKTASGFGGCNAALVLTKLN